jgi:hypothetical protein
LDLKYASIFQTIPQIKLHHIIIIKEDPEKESLYAIDFTPIIDPNNNKRLDLALNKNVPAEVRIRSMNRWSLNEWYTCPTINVNCIKNKDLREPISKILNKWKFHTETKLYSDDCVMNMYNHNCQHFSRFFIDEL